MPEFKLLCEDYATARRALDVWRGDAVRAGDYRRIIGELEDEILEVIEAEPQRKE